MVERRSLNVPLARVLSKPQGGKRLRTLAWGDRLDFHGVEDGALKVATVRYNDLPDGSVMPDAILGYIRLGPGRTVDDVLGPDDHRVLAVDFVDVQQGDAAVIETPRGRRMLIDGGENKLFARYLANRFPWGGADAPTTGPAVPVRIDTIVVTHGDADHFAGIPLILESETDPRPHKRIVIAPKVIHHNGLVKGPNAQGAAMLGPREPDDEGNAMWLTRLVDDPRSLPRAEMNEPFRAWCDAIDTYAARAQEPPLTVARLDSSSTGAFTTFGDDGLDVEILAPIVRSVRIGGELRPALPYLGTPSESINGHSIVLRMTYGRCRFLFTGDLNSRAVKLLADGDDSRLQAEVLKAPHHGSGDFSAAFLRKVSPVLSVVSSGDENPRLEYVHPRATLLGALGRHSRIDTPLIFVTEMVAFFNVEGYVGPDWHEMTGLGAQEAKVPARQVVNVPRRKRFFSFSRKAWGTVHVRTDGDRLLVWTDSALDRLKEAYLVDLRVDPPRLDEVSAI